MTPPMTPPVDDWVVDHLSQKWSANYVLLLGALIRSADGGASVMSLTEVADKPRPAALASWGRSHGWGVCQAREPWQHGENAVLYDEDVWDLVHRRVVVIGPDLGPGLVHTAVIVVLDHKVTGHRLLYSATHLPSAVEGLFGRTKITGRAAHYRDFTSAWRRELRVVRRQHRPDVEVLAADWNMNLNRALMRARLQTMFLGYRFAVTVDDTPTHKGGRRIDAHLVRVNRRRRADGTRTKPTRCLAGSRQRTLPAHRSSDHRGVRLTGQPTYRPGQRRNTRPGQRRPARPTYTATHGSTR